MFFTMLAASLLAAQTHPAKRPSPCHTLTDRQFSGPLTLSEPCYFVNGFVNVSGAVEIAPGTHLVFGEGTTLSLQPGGSLHAVGTVEAPIVFEGKEHTPGYWRGLDIATNSAKNQLSYTTVADAGPGNSDSAAIMVNMNGRLALDHSTVRNTAGFGLYVGQKGTLARFEANDFDNTGTPLSVKASDLAMLDPASTFANNKNNYVYVYFNECDLTEDQTWRAIAIPFRFNCIASVHSHLTVEPGARLEFNETFGMNISENGSLTAIGTQTRPVVFTGADPTPGFWTGLFFQSNSLKNVIQHAVITYGGVRNGEISSGICLGVRAGAEVRDTEIGFSEAAGIRIMQDARLNADAASVNNLHDNQQNIDRRQ